MNVEIKQTYMKVITLTKEEEVFLKTLMQNCPPDTDEKIKRFMEDLFNNLEW